MTTTQCAHHWIIETPDGPVSKGVCRLCGEEREFTNSTEFQSTRPPRTKEYPVAPQPEKAEDDG